MRIIDVKMFESSKWNLFETGGSDSESNETAENEDNINNNENFEEDTVPNLKIENEKNDPNLIINQETGSIVEWLQNVLLIL